MLAIGTFRGQVRARSSFDFDAQSTLERALLEELATLRFVEEKANVLMVGPPRVGKTIRRK